MGILLLLLVTSDEIKGKSGGWGSLGFFLGGETMVADMFGTISTNHGFTRFTFCSNSGSSHETFNHIETNMKQMNLINNRRFGFMCFQKLFFSLHFSINEKPNQNWNTDVIELK